MLGTSQEILGPPATFLGVSKSWVLGAWVFQGGAWMPWGDAWLLQEGALVLDGDASVPWGDT